MKQITMMSGRQIIISDDERDNISKVVEAGRSGIIQLRNGDMINMSSIETISEPETEAYFMGNKMSKDLTKVFVQGEWKLFAGEKEKIEYKLKVNNNNNGESKLLQ